MNENDKPYYDINTNGKIIRTFEKDVPLSELVWHRDARDREVKVIMGEGWKFQRDNELPIEMKTGQTISIDKLQYHRIIKGSGKLVIEIKEY